MARFQKKAIFALYDVLNFCTQFQFGNQTYVANDQVVLMLRIQRHLPVYISHSFLCVCRLYYCRCQKKDAKIQEFLCLSVEFYVVVLLFCYVKYNIFAKV